jgi:hypothetical protein
MTRISAYLGTVKPVELLGGIVAKSYRNGGEVLVEWREWKDDVWTDCPFRSQDKTKCSAQLCPCGPLRVNLWMNTISGYLGTVKMVKYLHSKNGNGKNNGNGNGNEQDPLKAE